MRLTAKEKQVILQTIRAADPDSQVFLFGSRVEDQARGGDIDLLVLSETLNLASKVDVLVSLKSLLGEQKIDLLIANSNKAKTDPFVVQALKKAVELD